MVTNFEIIKDFRDVRSMADCFAKSEFCCQKLEYKRCSDVYSPTEMKTQCFRCWLDFLTSDSGLHSNLDEQINLDEQYRIIHLSEKSKEILRSMQGVK